jgi:hypothetical protein
MQAVVSSATIVFIDEVTGIGTLFQSSGLISLRFCIDRGATVTFGDIVL